MRASSRCLSRRCRTGERIRTSKNDGAAIWLRRVSWSPVPESYFGFEVSLLLLFEPRSAAPLQLAEIILMESAWNSRSLLLVVVLPVEP